MGIVHQSEQTIVGAISGGRATMVIGYLSVGDISPRNASGLHVCHAPAHNAQPFLVRDYLD